MQVIKSKLRRLLFVSILAVNLANAQIIDSTINVNLPLQKSLIELRSIDQSSMKSRDITEDQLDKILHSNQTKLGDLVQRYGWPKLSEVGNDAAQGAWLIVQHADYDRKWQREMLELMEALVPKNEVRKQDIAYLRDRLDFADNLPQRYGTQGRCVGKDKWQPMSLANPDMADEWRKSMDMTTLDAYVKYASSILCKSFKDK